MYEPQRECTMDYELLKALRRGDKGFVRTFFPQDTESSDEITSELCEDAENVIIDRARICRSWRGVTAGGNSALHIVAGCGHVELAMYICARDNSLLTARNAAGEMPLHCAGRAGAGRIASHFISVAKGSHRLEEVLLAKDREGKTALYVAAEERHAAVARALMSADPGLAAIDDDKGVSPLYVAVLSESLKVVQILIESPDTSYGGPNGQSALHAATKIKNPEIAKKLLQWKPILAKKVDNSRSTPLHYLATTNNSYMVHQLLKCDTSPAYVKDSNGLCPVHIASGLGRSNIVHELIKHCPDMDELVDENGRNFLHVAVAHKRVDIVKFICQSLLHLKMMNAKDNYGNTPLHLATVSQNQGIMSLLLENRSVHQRIINKSHQTQIDDEITPLRHGSSSTKCISKMAAIDQDSKFLRSSPVLEMAAIDQDSKFVRSSPVLEMAAIDQDSKFVCSSPVLEMAAIDQDSKFVRSFPVLKMAAIDQDSKFVGSSPVEYRRDPFVPAPINKEEEEEEEEWERKGDELFDALMRRDESFIRSLFSSHSLAIEVHGADNVTDQAGRRSYDRNNSLLAARNAALETPLHCAARTGADQIVSLFIVVACQWEEGHRLEEVLRATDREGKTALHAAVEEGGHAAVAKRLVSEDPGLAAIVDDNGVSPLYAAVLSKSLQVVQILIELESPAKGRRQAGTASTRRVTPKTSYAGPKGQTALHAAAIVQSPEIANKLLKWKPKLTKKVDKSRSTPLHFLAITSNITMVCKLLEYDASLAYLSDFEGFYPIHIAASMGRCAIIRKLINNYDGMEKLVDNRGSNFLHIAVHDNRPMVVEYVCQHRELAKMMNARDNLGNTPLHLAVSHHNQEIVRLLVENGSVNTSIRNKDGRTPLDLAITQIGFGLISIQNPQIWIFHCLQQIGAICGPQRLDHLIYDTSIKKKITKGDREEELKKYESTTQNLVIVSVLIATVTFAAAFTMPGGNIADDHQNGGTPTLARKYAFTAFIISDFIAFLCSIMATIWLMYAGSQAIHPSRRLELILRSQEFIDVAAQSMIAAFALSVYVVLAPVNSLIGLIVCIFAFPSVLLSNPDIWQRFRLAMTLKRRLGWSAMCRARLIGRPLGYSPENFNWFIFQPIVSYLLVYILIFGGSLILSIKHLHFT